MHASRPFVADDAARVGRQEPGFVPTWLNAGCYTNFTDFHLRRSGLGLDDLERLGRREVKVVQDKACGQRGIRNP